MDTISFLTPEISQSDVVAFCDDHVNLKRDYADEYREQIKNLREHLDRYIEEHPDVGLVKMMLSGSLAKGTALSTMQDADVALYIKGDSAPEDLAELLEWLAERLRKTYSQIAPEKIYVDGPCVVIAFSGTGINVEVAPILYDGDAQDRGYLWDRSTGKRILTSIPQHLAFIRKRKDAQKTHFAQTIRLLKWWAQQRAADTDDFQFRSFLIELLMAKLADNGAKFDDYHSGLEAFFTYIQNTGLRQRIAFTDYYAASKLPKQNTGPIEVFDPINPENNVADNLTENDRRLLVELAGKALDALAYARTCQTKGDAIDCWQELMGPSFNP
jgi:tRNA nucleotidyltransferase (CCA-adding enzyme)